MRTMAHIFGGMPPFGPITPLFGGTAPLFGGARLPNGLEANNSGDGFCDDMMRQPRLTRRAVGTKGYPPASRETGLHPLRTFYARKWQTLGRRLGAFLTFDLIEGLLASMVSGRSLGRSGASPYQPLDHRVLMTNTKIFVPCFEYSPVSI